VVAKEATVVLPPPRLLPNLLPRPWPATDAGRQAWNIGPEDSHPWTVLDDLPKPTEQMVAYSRSDSNATTHRATAAHESTQDRGALAHRPAPWPELIKMRSFSQASRVPARLIW